MYTNESTPYIWDITERFYSAQAVYMAIYNRYEDMVAHYVEEYGLPRAEIRLEPQELTELLRFKELERIRDEYLLPLKNASHALFRTDDSTDFLDRLVNDIFHELSILKEEHYNVLTYSSDESERTELNTILDEVHMIFPIKVHRMRHLFELARERLERILPGYRTNTVLIRSLFLYRNEFVSAAYDDGLVGFYRLMYGEGRTFDGFRHAGDSFHKSGFYPRAVSCYQLGRNYLNSLPADARNELHESWREATEHFETSIRQCRELQEKLDTD